MDTKMLSARGKKRKKEMKTTIFVCKRGKVEKLYREKQSGKVNCSLNGKLEVVG